MKVATGSAPTPAQAGLTHPPERSSQVHLWAVLGAISTAVILAGWGQWIFSNDFASSPTGPDTISGTRLAILRTVEVGSLLTGVYFVWRFLLKPLLRERALTLDGKIVIAGILMWFYDPMVNFLNFTSTYNTHMLNRGSWARFIPGFEYPNQNLFAEPLLFCGGAYLWYILLGGLVGCSVIRRLRSRYPQKTLLWCFTVLAAVLAVVDLVLEMLFLRTEVYLYPGMPRGFTLFAGSRYQFPVIAAVLASALWTGITMLRYFRDDHGLTFAERGLERTRIPAKGRSVLSLLAVTGFLHVWILVIYYLPWQVAAGKADTVPALPSYLRAGICGDGTDFACPSNEVPVPSRGSIHLGPDDPRLSGEVRGRQGTP